MGQKFQNYSKKVEMIRIWRVGWKVKERQAGRNQEKHNGGQNPYILNEGKLETRELTV